MPQNPDYGQIPSFGDIEIPTPPRPSVDNFLEGLGMFWGQLSPTNGYFELASGQLQLPDMPNSSFNESTKRALEKKGWIENIVTKGMMFSGTM